MEWQTNWARNGVQPQTILLLISSLLTVVRMEIREVRGM